MSRLEIIGILLCLAGLAGTGWGIYHHIDQGGYNRCQTEYKDAAQAAMDTAQKNVSKVEKSYAPKIQKLQETPDTGYGVGPLVGAAIDGL